MPSFSPKSLPGRRRILWLLIAFTTITICLGSIAAMVLYADAHHSLNAQDMVSHTQEVRLNLESVSEQLDRINLNAQLYAAMGTRTPVRAAEAAAVSLSGQVAQLRLLVQDNAAQKLQAEQLQEAVEKLGLKVDRLKMYGGSVTDEALACRRLVSAMQGQEGMLLDQRAIEAQRENLYGLVRRAVVIVVGTILILVLFGFLIRDAARSWKYEERLSEANTQMRSTVKRLEEQAFESRLLIDARDEVALCLDVKQAQECTVRYFAELIPGTAGSLCILNNSRHVMESVGSWGVVRGSTVVDGFAPECCCALRSGRVRWRQPEKSEVHCTHFSGNPPQTYLCLPVVAHGDALGVVTIECLSPEAAAMTQAREESVISLTEMAAMAISGLRLRENLERQSIRDGMTGLFNRSFMEVALERELHRAARQRKELALMMVDIDHFKQFNDTFGHEAGDLVLREVAESLRLGVRGEDIACRFGGEEFVIILPEIAAEAAMERADLLRRQIQDLALRYHGQPLRQVTISIGLAMSPENADIAGDLLRCADRAMYAAKHRGRNQVVQADSSILA